VRSHHPDGGRQRGPRYSRIAGTGHLCLTQSRVGRASPLGDARRQWSREQRGALNLNGVRPSRYRLVPRETLHPDDFGAIASSGEF
jgi:hypothetical protein